MYYISYINIFHLKPHHRQHGAWYPPNNKSARSTRVPAKSQLSSASRSSGARVLAGKGQRPRTTPGRIGQRMMEAVEMVDDPG